MEDLQIALNSARVDQRNQGLWVRSWHIGQTLQALVVDKSPSRGTLLRIDGHQLVIPADIPAQKGANLMMQVAHMHPAPVLKLIQVINPAPPPVINLAALSEISQRLTKQSRVLISKQGKLDSAISALLGLRIEEQPEIRVNLIESLRQVIPKTADLTGSETVLASLRDLGSFSGPSRANMTQLFTDLQKEISSSSLSSKSALSDQIQAALARIALNQLAGAEDERGEARRYYLDLPLWFNDDLSVVHLHIKHELDTSDDSGDNKQRWQLWCQLDTPATGKVVTKIYLDAENIAVVISARSGDFLHKIESQIGQLKEAMIRSGLKVSTARCQSDEIPMPLAMDHFANALDELA